MEINFPPLPRHAQDDPWVVFDCEVEMYFEAQRAIERVNKQLEGKVLPEMLTLKNAVVESMVLHTRVLVDVLISKKKEDDDIGLNDLSPQWCEMDKAKGLIDELREAYGNIREPYSPCWVFNKMLAHATRQRSNSYNYGSALNKISDPIFSILLELQSFTGRESLKHYLD